MHNAYPLNEFGLSDDVKGVSAGLRVFIDDDDSEYFDYRHGINLPIGSVSSLGITKHVDKFLTPPHGICDNSVKFKTDSSCLYDWYTKEIIANCHQGVQQNRFLKTFCFKPVSVLEFL